MIAFLILDILYMQNIIQTGCITTKPSIPQNRRQNYSQPFMSFQPFQNAGDTDKTSFKQLCSQNCLLTGFDQRQGSLPASPVFLGRAVSRCLVGKFISVELIKMVHEKWSTIF
jgi:hypothetical protein